jgi:hypothetical protein
MSEKLSPLPSEISQSQQEQLPALPDRSLAMKAAKALVEAKVGETLKIELRVRGILSLLHWQGYKFDTDEEGRIQLKGEIPTKTDIMLNSYDGLSLPATVHSFKNYENLTEYINEWGIARFRGNFTDAIAESLSAQKKAYEEQELKQSFQRRTQQAAIYGREVMKATDMGSLTAWLEEAIKVWMTGEISSSDDRFWLNKHTEAAAELINNAFEFDVDGVELREGRDEDELGLVTSLSVKKKAELPLSPAELKVGWYRLNW